ncbi:MAG TPA: hypothetical protein VGF85_06260 [Opitutaceae bacterium]|jgi:hypothetical protein
MSTHDPDKLEAALNQMFKGLPNRKAPAAFQSRVFAELSRRAALPWWRKSFAYWPVAIRAGFFIGSAAIVALLVSGVFILMRSPAAVQSLSDAEQPFAWLRQIGATVASARVSVQHVVALIPPLWLYGAVGAIVIGYASLAAIGAATYRIVNLGRRNS